MTEIVSYQPKYASVFKDLNTAWLEKYFVVECHDTNVLSNPDKSILEKGGDIYFLLEEGIVKGTVALMYNKFGELELTKMAVEESSKGKGFGNLLLQHSIDKAREMKAENLILYSSKVLTPAISLYRKFGFEEIPVEQSEYQRCDIKMRKSLL